MSGTNTNNSHPFPVILQASTLDIGGGAEKIAWELHQSYLARGYQSYLAVGQKRSDDPTILRIPNKAYRAWWIKLFQKAADGRFPLPVRIRRVCSHLAKFHHRRAKERGYENFYFPGSWHLLDLPSQKPDILHCHNLHGLYFDLRTLPSLSSQIPVMLTLHDNWMLGGYCAYAFDCERWKTGCGECPQIQTFPVLRDATAENWTRKQALYARSRLYIATPSRWLMNMVEQSILAPAIIENRVIYNGMDLSLFYPVDKAPVRTELGIPADAKVILTTGAKILLDRRKDYQTMREAVMRLARMLHHQPLSFVVLGSEQRATEQIDRLTIQWVPFQREAASVARYYQAADVYIHAAKADNLPNTVSEALACGTPVVATAIGGIPEQVEDGVTGFLVPPGNPDAMADAMQTLLNDDALRQQMSRRAVETARQRFDVNRMVDDYLTWYQEILG